MEHMENGGLRKRMRCEAGTEIFLGLEQWGLGKRRVVNMDWDWEGHGRTNKNLMRPGLSPKDDRPVRMHDTWSYESPSTHVPT
jgi:hypothetical protein